MKAQEARLAAEGDRLGKVLFALAREPDDHVGREGHAGDRIAKSREGFAHRFDPVGAAPRRKHRVGTRLERKVKVRGEFFDRGKSGNRRVGHHLGRKRTQADALDGGLLRDVGQEIDQPIAIEVDPVRRRFDPGQNDLSRAV